MTLEEQIEALHKAQMHYENDRHKEGNMTNYTPVEKKDDYASKGVAGTALGFGIGGTVLNLLNQGGLGLLGGRCGCKWNLRVWKNSTGGGHLFTLD